MSRIQEIALFFALAALAGCGRTTGPAPADRTPPGRVVDLAATAPSVHGFHLTFTAPGDDGAVGTPAEYDLRVSFGPLTAQNVAQAPRYPVTLSTLPAGAPVAIDVARLFAGVKYYAAVRAIDAAGQAGPFSNIVPVQLRDRDWVWDRPTLLRSIDPREYGSIQPFMWHTLALGIDGTVYVAGVRPDSLLRYDASGGRLRAWPLTAPAGDVATLPDGRVLLLTRSSPRVRLFSAGGDSLAAWGEFGPTAGGLCAPAGMATDAEGHVYLSERTATGVRVHKFDTNGIPLATVGEGVPDCHAEASLRLVITAWHTVLLFDPVARLMREYSLDLAPLRSWPPSAPGARGFFLAMAIATDADGYIYLAEGSFLKWIMVFRADGSPAGAFPSPINVVTDWETDPRDGTVWAIDVEADGSVINTGDHTRYHLHHVTWLPTAP